jgi:hypothetical protein
MNRATHKFNRSAPTPFVDYYGTLHIGGASGDAAAKVRLDSGGPLLEFASLLLEMLEPYPSVRIVLTTSWLQIMSPEHDVMAYLPPKLACKVCGHHEGQKGAVELYAKQLRAHRNYHLLRNRQRIEDLVSNR